MSPPRRRDSPVESVQLRVTLRGDVKTSRKIKRVFPAAVLKEGRCEVVIEGRSPQEVAVRAKEFLEKVRGVVEPEKDFKRTKGPARES